MQEIQHAHQTATRIAPNQDIYTKNVIDIFKAQKTHRNKTQTFITGIWEYQLEIAAEN